MRTIKYHLALTDNGYSLIINSLNNLRNDLIAQGRYTDAVDDVLVEFIGAKKKDFCPSVLFYRWVFIFTKQGGKTQRNF